MTSGQIAVDEKPNEIPKLPELLDPLPLEGAVVTADNLHTQQDTARYLVETKKAITFSSLKTINPPSAKTSPTFT